MSAQSREGYTVEWAMVSVEGSEEGCESGGTLTFRACTVVDTAWRVCQIEDKSVAQVRIRSER